MSSSHSYSTSSPCLLRRSCELQGDFFHQHHPPWPLKGSWCKTPLLFPPELCYLQGTAGGSSAGQHSSGHTWNLGDVRAHRAAGIS